MCFIFTLYLKAPPGPTPPDKDVIPLCCCKINGASFKKLGSTVTYCQALDSMDGKVRNMTEIKYLDICFIVQINALYLKEHKEIYIPSSW